MAIELNRRPGEDIEVFLRKFKKIVWDSGIVQSLKERRSFKKPSTIKNVKNEKIKRAKQNAKKTEEKDKLKKNNAKRKGYTLKKKRKKRFEKNRRR